MGYPPDEGCAMAESAACFAGNMGKATLAVKSGRPGAGLRAGNLGRREIKFLHEYNL
jgi:hypothetical protein